MKTTVTITTHNGTFHADEVTACALIEIVERVTATITRVPHQTTGFNTDYVVDIGRVYDALRQLFDHHQWYSSEDGRSSAGLVWGAFFDKGDYPEIDTFIKAVDDNDVGIKPATQMEYSRLISLFNHQDIHSPEQDEQFRLAVDFAKHILNGMIAKQAAINHTADIVTHCPLFEGTTNVLQFPEWVIDWGKFVNGETMPHIHAVVYPDHTLDTWNIQTTQVSPALYDKVGKPLPINSSVPMDFIHKDGFFAVAPSYDVLMDFIAEWKES